MLKAPVEDLQTLFDVAQRPNLRPRYNIAPSQDIIIVRSSNDHSESVSQSEYELASVRWGLIPSWAESPQVGYKMINARAETVDRLPSYRDAYTKRRCLIPSDGFFEWRVLEDGATKQPYLIRMRDQGTFAFAGLYERWRSPDRTLEIESCTIITTKANRYLSGIHHRMPVILSPKDFASWLDRTDEGLPLLRPCPDSWLETIMIGDRINKPLHDDASVLEPIEKPIEPAQGSLF